MWNTSDSNYGYGDEVENNIDGNTDPYEKVRNVRWPEYPPVKNKNRCLNEERGY